MEKNGIYTMEFIKENNIAVKFKGKKQALLITLDGSFTSQDRFNYVLWDKKNNEWDFGELSWAKAYSKKVINFDQVDFKEDKLKFKGGSEIMFDKKTRMVKGFNIKACCDPKLKIENPSDDYNLKKTETKKYELRIDGKDIVIKFKKFCEVGKCTLWELHSCKFSVGFKEFYNFNDWVMLGKISSIIQNTMDELNGV